MNLSRMLAARAASGAPVKAVLIGAGKFGTMYLAQARLTTGVQIVAVVDRDVAKAKAALAAAGWPAEQYAARSPEDAAATGATCVTDDVARAIGTHGVEVVVEATGDPAVGIRHCLAAIGAGRHIVMVNVEADVLAGPLLARRAEQAGVVYSLAWGDQPALICEHVDWARTCGFKVVAAGKGTRYLPRYHWLNPDTTWEEVSKYLAFSGKEGLNLKMFNSFLDGTKSGIEMTAVCNATGLTPQPDGLSFPPASRFELADICKPASEGGVLSHSGTTEVVSSLTRKGEDVPHHLAMGTYVVIEGETDYARRCFTEYHTLEDRSGRFAALYRPTHMIGLELGISIASAALRGEPTGCPHGFHSDVAATAKMALKAGETLDGEGGFCVWGKQQPASISLEKGFLPIGLASGVRLKRDIAEGEIVRWADVEIDEADDAVVIRRQMEALFSG